MEIAFRLHSLIRQNHAGVLPGNEMLADNGGEQDHVLSLPDIRPAEASRPIKTTRRN